LLRQRAKDAKAAARAEIDRRGVKPNARILAARKAGANV
jgi:hypothetical protein